MLDERQRGGRGGIANAAVDEKLNEQLSGLLAGIGVFVDEVGEVPYRLHFFEVSIRGQNSKGEQQTLHGELVAVREDLSGPTTGSGRFSIVPADCLLDLPVASSDQVLPCTVRTEFARAHS